jgi:rare lipoprotein A
MPRLIAITLVMAIFISSQVAWASPIYTASYYTTASCRREGTSGIMANGRRLQDEGVCTAAMWKVPFGTKVRVRNIENNKEVVVTITDRGPAKRLVRRGRIIDLNYEAMRRLDGIRKGLIQVEITILN